MWQGDGPTPEVDAIFSHLSSTTRACCTGKAKYSCTHMKIAVSVTRDAVCRNRSSFKHHQVTSVAGAARISLGTNQDVCLA